jgi:hypothetical protein
MQKNKINARRMICVSDSSCRGQWGEYAWRPVRLMREFGVPTLAGSVKAVPKAGGTVVVRASGTPQGSIFPVAPLGISVDSNNVYWGEVTNGGAIRSVPKPGGQVVDVVRGQGPVGWLALETDRAACRKLRRPGAHPQRTRTAS